MPPSPGSVSRLRLTTWNCRSGSALARLHDLASLNSDLVFLQECRPESVLPIAGHVLTRAVGNRKGVALACLNPSLTLQPLSRRDAPAASLAAMVEGPLPFLLLALWSRAPDYQAEVVQMLDAYADAIATQPTVLIGDLNIGWPMGATSAPTRRHRAFERLASDGFVSAYHAFHGVGYGCEPHATYFHQARADKPWHIDYCYVPKAWAKRVQAVEVGGDDEWRGRSDHRPVTVTLGRPRVGTAQRSQA